MKDSIAHLERFPRYLASHSNRLPGITKGATYIKVWCHTWSCLQRFSARQKKALLTVTHTGSFKLQKENIECCIYSWLTVYLLIPCFTSIHYFHIDHNAPCLPAEFCVTIVSYFSKVLQSSQKIHYNVYAKFWGINEVHYGLCKNGELHPRAHAPESGPYPASPVFLRPFFGRFLCLHYSTKAWFSYAADAPAT